jgi:hypothetical protein
MNISKAELQSIVKILPIGLYAKRGIKVSIEDEETSFYSPMTDEIVVSYPQILTALSKVADDSPYKENIVRSVLYHEVSHAFMTPDMNWDNVINVFEDERMETLLANYYYDVDFKSNVFRFNGLEVGQIPPATDGFSAFYNLVRFRSGKPRLLEKVADIIEKYSAMTKTNDTYYTWDYYRDVHRLYREVCVDYDDNPQDYQQGSGEQGTFSGDIKGEPQNQGNTQDNGEDKAQGTNDPNSIGRDTAGALSDEVIKELIANVINNEQDPSLVSYFQTIINNFNKKNSKGSSINGYSGVINPRLANREDCKMFDRPFTQKANNSFGTFHLNLFIDCSGSFYYSQTTANKILSALTAIEKQNPNFTLDVVFCGEGETVAKSPRDRQLRCGGGNDLDDDIYGIYRSLQKANTYNYNIVLFDGNAFSNCHSKSPHRKNFRAFDFSNCTIISDEDNRRYIEKTVKRARVIYTKSYTDELLDNVCKVLSKAFR